MQEPQELTRGLYREILHHARQTAHPPDVARQCGIDPDTLRTWLLRGKDYHSYCERHLYLSWCHTRLGTAVAAVEAAMVITTGRLSKELNGIHVRVCRKRAALERELSALGDPWERAAG